MSDSGAETQCPNRLVEVVLQDTGGAQDPPEIARERQLAIQNLLESNRFAPVGAGPGPYAAVVTLQGERMLFNVSPLETGASSFRVAVPVGDLTPLVRDYHAICQSYYRALQRASVTRIEAIDMGRRALHDEGASLMAACLEGRVGTDFDTARRLFTLLAVMQMRSDSRLAPGRLSPDPSTR